METFVDFQKVTDKVSSPELENALHESGVEDWLKLKYVG